MPLPVPAPVEAKTSPAALIASAFIQVFARPLLICVQSLPLFVERKTPSKDVPA
ncbi:MAG: hypothetical protein ACE5I1_02935 [bacterium]